MSRSTTSAGSSASAARSRAASMPHAAATADSVASPRCVELLGPSAHRRDRCGRDEPTRRRRPRSRRPRARPRRGAPSPRACTTAAAASTRSPSGRARRATASAVRRAGATSSTTAPPTVACAPDDRSTIRSPGASGSGGVEVAAARTGRRRRGCAAARPVRPSRRARATVPRRGRDRPGSARSSTSTVSTTAHWSGAHDRRTPFDLGVFDAREVQRDAVSRGDAVELLVLRLDPAHPGAGPAGFDHDFVVAGERAAGQRARHDRARALGREHAIDPEARPAGVARRGRVAQHRVERGAHVVEAAPVDGVDRDDRPADPLLQLEARERERVVVDEATPSSTRPCRACTSSSSRICMCSSVCGIQPSFAATTSTATSTAPTPASMFFTKRTWPGTSTKPTTWPDGKFAEREAEIDGQAARLLLGEAIGIGAGEREHERRLPVVDVTGGRDHSHSASAERSAAARRASSAGSTVRRSHTTRSSSMRATMRAARSRAVTALTDAGSTATPHDGMVEAGQRAAARDRFGVDDLRARNRGRDRFRAHAQRVDRRARHAPERDRRRVARRGTRTRRTADPASVTLSARSARASGCAFSRSIERAPADDDARLRSAEQLVARERDERGAARRCTGARRARRAARRGRSRSQGVVSSSRPEPASTTTESPRPARLASSATETDETNPIMR